MVRTGQSDALVVAELVRLDLEPGRACTTTTWTSGRITVLPRADVVVLTELPTTVDGAIRHTTVRWDVLARVCGARCWQRVPDLDPPRWITRRWPTQAELEVLTGLALPPA